MMQKNVSKVRRSVATIVAAAALLSSIPTAMPTFAVNTEGKEKLSAKLAAPQTLYVWDDAVHNGSDESCFYVQYTQTAETIDFINQFYGDQWGWGVTDETEDNYYTGFGKGYREEYIGVQLDYQLDDGDWHYTKDWDTTRYGAYDDYSLGFDGDSSYYPYLTGEARAFRGSYVGQLKNGEIDDCIEAGVVDAFQAVTDGTDTYYRFDAEKHTLTFRARYYAVINYDESYGAPAGTERQDIVLLSDWSESVKYGKGISTELPVPDSLEAPEFAPYIKHEIAYGNAPELGVFLTANPQVMQYSFGGSSQTNVDLRFDMEISLDGKQWIASSKWERQVTEAYFSFDFYDVWELMDGNSDDKPYAWTTADVYLRGKYQLSYSYNDTVIESLYSEPVTMEIPGADAYTVTIMHGEAGWGGKGTTSFQTSEGADLGWIACDFLEGCYVQTVLVNDTVMYDRDKEDTFALLEWYLSGDERTEFRFWEHENQAYQDLDIAIIYGGLATQVWTVTVEETPFQGTISCNDLIDKDVDKAVVMTAYEGADLTLSIRPPKACRVAEVKHNGQVVAANNLSVDDEGMVQYHLGEIAANHTISVTYEQISAIVRSHASGDGSVLDPVDFADVMSPEESLFFAFSPLKHAETGEVATVEKIVIKETISVDSEKETTFVAGDTIFDAAVLAGGFLFTTPSVELCADAYDIYVTFSTLKDPEKEKYTIAVTAGAGGHATETQTVTEGSNCTIRFTPDAGYRIDTVTVDGKVIANLAGDSYSFENVTQDHTVSVTFAPVAEEKTYRVEVSVEEPEGAANVVTPRGVKTLAENESFTLTWELTEGYEITRFSVNGQELTAEQVTALQGTYAIEQVTENTTIAITIASIECVVTFEDGAGNVLESVTCLYGEGVKPSIDLHSLTKYQQEAGGSLRLFDHWSEDVSSHVFHDTTVVALYADYQFQFTAPTKTKYDKKTGALDLTGMKVLLTITQQTTPDNQDDAVVSTLDITNGCQCEPNTLDLAFQDSDAMTISVFYALQGAALSYSDMKGQNAVAGAFSITYGFTPQLGDVDMDGDVDSSDATLVLMYYVAGLAGTSGELTDEQLSLAEVDGKPGVTANDATMILQYYVAGLTGKTVTWDDLR